MVFLQGSFVWDVLAVIEQNIKWKAWLDSATDNKGQRSKVKKKSKMQKNSAKRKGRRKVRKGFPVQ